MALSLPLHRHTLSSHAYAHTLSLGYYQDKSIWSIQGSGCHFIHIFSSLVTLLKATASIYPEWMNAPTDETRRGKNETHTAWNDQSQSACHFQNMFWDPCVFNAIGEDKKKKKSERGDCGACGLFAIHLQASKRQRARLPASQWQENGCWDSQLGEEKWDVVVSGGTVQRKLEWRQKCVYSCQLVSWPSSGLPLPSVRRGN